MTYLPDRRRDALPQPWEPRHDLAHPDAIEWRPVRRGSSFMPIVLTVVFAATTGRLVRSAIEHPRAARLVTVERQASAPPVVSPAAPPVSGPCAEADRTVRNGPHVGGFAPRDVFGFLPSCDGGRL